MTFKSEQLILNYDLVQDCDLRQALVNTAVNIPVPRRGIS